MESYTNPKVMWQLSKNKEETHAYINIFGLVF